VVPVNKFVTEIIWFPFHLDNISTLRCDFF